MVTTQGTTFALAKTAEFNLCRHIMTQTEHPLYFGNIAGTNIQGKIENLRQ